jgi:hypothetical protein
MIRFCRTLNATRARVKNAGSMFAAGTNKIKHLAQPSWLGFLLSKDKKKARRRVRAKENYARGSLHVEDRMSVALA